jgi:RNase H-fold protein (predicted Holliday junction resolvase)
MVDAGMNKKKRQDKGNLDMVSATVILQSYMDFIS